MQPQKVLFSHSYFYPLDPKQWKNKTPYPPLGTIYAASYLREHNFEVSLYDTNLLENSSGVEKVFSEQQPDFFVVYDDCFNYLSKMCLTNMREEAFKMLQKARERNIFSVVCSSDSTDHYEKYLNAGADVVIRGEGELALLEVLNNADKISESIQGIAFKRGEEIITSPKRPILKELDQLPQPAWDLVDVDAYKKVWKSGKYDFALNVATTRGCPFKCNWCAKPIYGIQYNSRSPQRVADEIEFLINTYQVDKFWMCDDIFGLKPGWVSEFSKLIKERNLNFGYKIQSRADLLVKDETIKELAESGLKEVWIGAESGSQKILDAMDKGITIEQIKEATQQLKKYKIKVAYFLQLGYLGETKEDIAKTLKMIREFQPDDIGISVSYPLPGTKFFDVVEEQLGNKANWTDSDELAMMFNGTFNTRYYKNLHRYIHRLYRFNQGMKSLFNPKQLNLRKIFSIPYHALWMVFYKLQLNFQSNLNE